MAQPPGPKCKILCVDDNPSAVAVRAGMLELHGYAVETLTDERQVLAFLENNLIHIVVLDYLMPEIRGDQLATILKQHFPTLPILLISGAVDHPASIGGADLFISKQGGHQHLLQVLAEWTQAGRFPSGGSATRPALPGAAA